MTPPLSVVIVGQGHHLFESLLDDRIRVVAPAADAPPADLIVFPCGTDRRFEKILAAPLPEHLRLRLLQGSTGVVFDASTEAVGHKPDTSAALHLAVHALGVSPLSCVYITQDRNYDSDYRAHCAAIGCNAPVAVLNYDYWICHTLGEFGPDGYEEYERRVQAFQSRCARRSRRFVSLNRTPRPTKILFLLSLLRDGLFDAGFISFGGFSRGGLSGKPRPTPEQLARVLPGFEDKVSELAPLLDALDDRGPVLFSTEGPVCRLPTSDAVLAADLPAYAESWFSVVTETEMRPRPSRVTEKVVKPLVNFHPMVVFGNPGALRMVERFGFATFPEIFDQAYDDEIDPRRRFDLVYAEIVRACRRDEKDLARLEAHVAEKLVFNARWGLTQFTDCYRRQGDAALVNDILACVGRSLPDGVVGRTIATQ